MKKIIAMIAITVIALTLCSCVKTDNNIDNYSDDIKAYEASSFMPGLDNIGKYNDVEYFSRKDESIFPEYSMQLVVKYNEEEFLKEKEILNTAYTYLESPQKADFDDTVFTIPIEEFSAYGYDFKITKFEDTVYPKNFGMIGISDEKFEIVYLWIYAPDLDYICETNANEIKEINEFLEYHFSLE
jgi:hypothetical protein